MQCKSRAAFAFRIKASFCTPNYLYAFYYVAYDTRMQLARFCLYSYTWQRIRSFNKAIPDRCGFIPLALPWSENHREVLLFWPSHCSLLTLGPPSTRESSLPLHTTVRDLDLISMLALPDPDEMVVNIEMAIYISWQAVTVDRERQAVYALLEISLGAYNNRDLAVFRLDWPTRLWTRLSLVEKPETPLALGDFVAYHDDHLYIGMVSKDDMPAVFPTWTVDEAYILTTVVSAKRKKEKSRKKKNEWQKDGAVFFGLCFSN